MSITCCYIKEQYFKEHSSFVKMLDPGNTAKQSHRSYLCLKITQDGIDNYIPLRTHQCVDVRAYGRIGHSVPSASRSDAGLDYRYALIVNDSKYIEIPTTQKIPNKQWNKITADYNNIISEFTVYLSGFKKALKKNLINREALYRESSLINFTSELTS